MSEEKRCPECGRSLPEDASRGLCPACLMAQAFDSRGTGADDAIEPAAVPSVVEVAGRFPGYEVTACLGRGGMGVVYQARQTSLDRWVAIKVLAPDRVSDERFAEHFEREAKTLARMSHPNIVTVFDHGEADGMFYIVMEFVDGVNLRDLLRDGKMAPERALAIVPPICEALEYAHGKGVVHRDIKPENVLLDRDGRVKIADFGIASLVGATGELSGTPPYMAPEQEKGRVDRRADIYALGVVLYEMLTGERPAGDLVAPSRKVEVDVRIDEMVLRALEKEPERRYQTAAEFRTVAQTVASAPGSGRPPVAGPAESRAGGPPERKGMLRRWWWMFLVMLLVGPLLGLLVGAGVAYLAPKKYESSAIVQLSPTSPSEATGAFYPTWFEVITARETLEPVAQDLDLAQKWRVADWEVVGRLRGVIGLEHIRGTDLIEIRVRDTDPAEARAIAEGVVESLLGRIDSELGGAKVQVAVHEKPTVMDRPVSPNVVLTLALFALVGLAVSPLLALASMFLLQRLFPERRPDKVARQRRPAPPPSGTSRWALGLMLAVLPGTPLLLALVPGGRHDWVLIFAAACALGSLGCGLASWRTGVGRAVALAWLALLVLGGVMTGLYLRALRGREEAVRAEARAAEARAEMAQAAETARREIGKHLQGEWRPDLPGGVKAAVRFEDSGRWESEAVVLGRPTRSGGRWWLEGEALMMRKDYSSEEGKAGETERFEIVRLDDEVLSLGRELDDGGTNLTVYYRIDDAGSPTPRASAFVGRWLWLEDGTGDEVRLTVGEEGIATVEGSDSGSGEDFRESCRWELTEGELRLPFPRGEVVARLRPDGTLEVDGPDGGADLRFERAD